LAQLEVTNVTKIYQIGDMSITAVKDVSLQVNKGEFVAITGHSGSGKTTLLSTIGGIIKPTSGKVMFENTDICALDDDSLSEYRCEKIGFMFQFASLIPVLTAKENLLLPGIFSQKRMIDMEQKAVEYLKMIGLGDKINSYPAHLSGGQQRRVAIVRALMNDPEIILADEPTGDLDENTEAEVMEFFRKINEEQHITFILVTHSSEVAAQAKRHIRMSNGMVVEQ
jgi:putative ABC transport system ATP-binding protein/lipoprotein-releasing system ATP-binding protein